MGLFKKSKKAEPVVAAAPSVGPEDLVVAERVTGEFVEALGNDPLMRQTAYAISRAGGGPADFEESLRLAAHTGDTGIDRPWRWLAEILDHPGAVGNHRLAGRVAVVVLIWHREMRGQIGLADIGDMMLQPPPPALVTRICSAAVYHLVNADPELVVAGPFTAGGVLRLCSQEVLEIDPPAAEGVRRVAQRVLAS